MFSSSTCFVWRSFIFSVEVETPFKEADIARSLLLSISNDVGQIAYLHAKLHGLNKIYFGGYFIRGHPLTMHTITYAINFWSKVSIHVFAYWYNDLKNFTNQSFDHHKSMYMEEHKKLMILITGNEWYCELPTSHDVKLCIILQSKYCSALNKINVINIVCFGCSGWDKGLISSPRRIPWRYRGIYQRGQGGR